MADKKCPMKNSVGGQAVIEGVMMKNKNRVALSVRREDGTIEIRKSEFHPLKEKHKWANIPILRGIFGFVESMILSFKTLGDSTEMLGLEDEPPKKEKKKKKEKTPEEKAKAEKRLTAVIMVISLILGLGLALFLFSVLPSFVAQLFGNLTGVYNKYALACVEGVVKILIFIVYILLVSFMKDIKRTFQYHGAEHKSIACYESGLELTPENARKCTRFHPRCGTSFMFVMILLGVFVGMFIPFWSEQLYLRIILKVALLPVIMGVGYEFIMLAGKHNNVFTRILSAPGLWMQRITTKEPDDYQLAVAICSIKATMPEEFPDFTPDEYFITREQNKGHIGYTAPKKTEEQASEEKPAKDEGEKQENNSSENE